RTGEQVGYKRKIQCAENVQAKKNNQSIEKPFCLIALDLVCHRPIPVGWGGDTRNEQDPHLDLHDEFIELIRKEETLCDHDYDKDAIQPLGPTRDKDPIRKKVEETQKER